VSMGLLTGLLTLPVTGPVRATRWIAEQVLAMAEREYYDEEAIRRQIADAETALAAGDITDEEYEATVDALLQRLAEARARAAHEEIGEPGG